MADTPHEVWEIYEKKEDPPFEGQLEFTQAGIAMLFGKDYNDQYNYIVRANDDEFKANLRYDKEHRR